MSKLLELIEQLASNAHHKIDSVIAEQAGEIRQALLTKNTDLFVKQIPNIKPLAHSIKVVQA